MTEQLINARIIGDVEPGAEVGLNLRYSTDPDLENAAGLNVAIAYNSEIFEVEDADPDTSGLQIQNPFDFGLQGFSDQPDEDDIDNDPNTDRVINGAFADSAIFEGEDGAWPWEEVPEGQTSVNLGTVPLVLDENFDPDADPEDFINVTLREAQRGFDENERGDILDDLNVRNLDPDDQNEAPEVTPPDDVILITDDFEEGDEVFTVEATDPEGDEITFEITDGNTDVNEDGTPAFDIDDDGVVTVQDADDLEADATFNLEVTATDEFGAESEPETFEVNVEAGGPSLTFDPELGGFNIENRGVDDALRHTLSGPNPEETLEVGLVSLNGQTLDEAVNDGANIRTVFSLFPEEFENGERGVFEEIDQLSRILALNSDNIGYVIAEGRERTIDEIIDDGDLDSLQTQILDNEDVTGLQEGEGFNINFEESGISLDIDLATRGEAPLGSNQQGQLQSEVFDLSDVPAETITANLSFDVISEADFDNALGFYAVEDASGTVNGVDPGDDGYLDEVLGAALQDDEGNDVILQRNTTAEDFSVEVSGGQIIVPFLLPDVGDIDEFPDAAGGGDSFFGVEIGGSAGEVFTPYAAANPEGADHFRLLGDNIFGVEDLVGGGDQDFNDFVFGAEFTVA